MINSSVIKILGCMVISGCVGGYIGTKISSKAVSKNYLELEEQAKNNIEELKQKTINSLSEEARRAIRESFDSEAKELIVNEIEVRVRTIDISEVTNIGVERGISQAIMDAKSKIQREATDQLREEINQISKHTVEDRLTDELYKVNMRRIVEDSVDRAVRDEVRSAVKNKIPSWFSTDDIRRFLF